jgi:cytochrome P450
LTDVRTASVDWASAGLLADPYPLLAELRAAGPVHPLRQPNGLVAWHVTGYEAALAALADPLLSKDPRHARRALREAGAWFAEEDPDATSGSLFGSDPPAHTRLRRLVGAAFTRRRVAAMEAHLHQVATTLAHGLDGDVDLVERYAFPFATTVLCELLGLPAGDRDLFRDWTHAMLTPAYLPEAQLRRERANAGMRRYLADTIAARRAGAEGRAGAGVVQALVDAGDEDRLTDAELVNVLQELVIAGHETTTNLVCGGVLALLANPDQLRLLRRDVGLLPNAVEELLRFDGPVLRATLRFTTGDQELSGVPVPGGSIVTVVLGAANRDPRRFAEPDRLDVRRRDVRHLGFGHGIHHCLGAPLARLQAAAAMGALLRAHPGLRLSGEPTRRPAGIMRALSTLPVQL